MVELGTRLLDGLGLPQDVDEGARWLRKAAENGFKHAMGELGTRLQCGEGLPQDIDEGERWLRKAAENGT